jgi:hypothetical protein
MKQTLCSLFIGFSALAVSLAVPYGADAYTYCEYEDDCYFYTDAATYYPDESAYVGQYYYGNYGNASVESTSAYQGYCDEYDDGVDCYHYMYDRDVYATQPAPSIQFNVPIYTQAAAPTYTYPVYTPIYVPTPVPVQQRVEVPVTKTVTKTVYVPSKKKKKTGFSVTYSRGY